MFTKSTLNSRVPYTHLKLHIDTLLKKYAILLQHVWLAGILIAIGRQASIGKPRQGTRGRQVATVAR